MAETSNENEENEEPKEEQTGDDDASPPLEPERRHSLDAFSALQRQLAVVDFSGLTAAQRAIAKMTASNIPAILAAQNAIAKHFAQSINFSGLASTYKALLRSESFMTSATAQTQWAEALSLAVDFSALRDAFASSAAWPRSPRQTRQRWNRYSGKLRLSQRLLKARRSEFQKSTSRSWRVFFTAGSLLTSAKLMTSMPPQRSPSKKACPSAGFRDPRL
jgi:hypothetical protein